MPEIINTLFGRARNDTASSGEDVAATTTLQTDSPQPAEDVAETAPGADDVVESTEAEPAGFASADSDAEDSDAEDSDAEDSDAAAELDDDAADQADEDEPLAEATAETAAEESDEAAADEDVTDEAVADEVATDEVAVDEASTDEDLAPEAATEVADQDGESAEDIEPVAIEAEAEAEDAPVATETDADAETDAEIETDADDVDQAEPVVAPVAAETRPTAGTRGNITVGDEVVVKVVNIVAGKIDGVHSLDDGGISVEVDDGIATIKVSLVIVYGHAIKALAEQIRIDVIEAVEQFLGLDVAAVDVHVSDIHPPTAD
jgi:uncharacterized alkaline shock family protein YloU